MKRVVSGINCLNNVAFFLLFLLMGTTVKSQTIATDFTDNDCSGASHHLFQELDAGKIVVVSFVMPCSACVSPTISANNVVNSYYTSNPDKVMFYLSDDEANTTCTELTSWAVAS